MTNKEQRIAFLLEYRDVVMAHAKARIEDADFHGGSDDLNDLREIDAELRGLRFKDE